MNERVTLSMIGIVSAAVVLAVAVLLLGRGPAAGGALDVSALPALNAFLNGTSAVVLVVGYVFICRRQVTAYLTCMLTAFGVSMLFLISYVVDHYHAGSRPFTGPGWVHMKRARWTLPIWLYVSVTGVLGQAPAVMCLRYRESGAGGMPRM